MNNITVLLDLEDTDVIISDIHIQGRTKTIPSFTISFLIISADR